MRLILILIAIGLLRLAKLADRIGKAAGIVLSTPAIWIVDHYAAKGDRS